MEPILPRSERKDRKKKALVQVLVQLVDRYIKKPTSNLVQHLTQLVSAAQSGKLQTEGEPSTQSTHTDNNTDTSTNKKGKGKAKSYCADKASKLAQAHVPKKPPISYYPKKGEDHEEE